MVLDSIENYKLYTNLSERIAKAFEFITNNDLGNIALGKHIIDGDTVFALVQEYETKDAETCKLEAHYKYIDVQYVIKGTELMGINTLTNQLPVSKSEADDYAFYTDDCSFVKVNEGMFTIFFPNDLHMPCIKMNETATVKKVVVKVRI